MAFFGVAPKLDIKTTTSRSAALVSRSGALLDALAANRLSLAGEILALSPTVWREGEEYEDDFCYHRFLGLVSTEAPSPVLEECLTQFAGLAPDDPARLDVCTGLSTSEPDPFFQAFEDLLHSREAAIAADHALAEEDLCIAVGSKVFVEGLAVLQLARRRGFPIQESYRMCPLLALEPLGDADVVDDFR